MSNESNTQLLERAREMLDGIVKIPLGKNAHQGYALVDPEFAHLDQFKWTLSKNGYAVRDPKKYELCLMHHLIIGRKKKLDTDHINRNKLDNRQINLRHITRSLNNHNSIKSNGHMYSKHRGVTYDKTRGKWKAELKINGKVRVGYRSTETEALTRRQELEREYLHV